MEPAVDMIGNLTRSPHPFTQTLRANAVPPRLSGPQPKPSGQAMPFLNAVKLYTPSHPHTPCNSVKNACIAFSETERGLMM